MASGVDILSANSYKDKRGSAYDMRVLQWDAGQVVILINIHIFNQLIATI